MNQIRSSNKTALKNKSVRFFSLNSFLKESNFACFISKKLLVQYLHKCTSFKNLWKILNRQLGFKEIFYDISSNFKSGCELLPLYFFHIPNSNCVVAIKMQKPINFILYHLFTKKKLVKFKMTRFGWDHQNAWKNSMKRLYIFLFHKLNVQ